MQTKFNEELGSLTSKDVWPTSANPATISEGYGVMLSKIIQAYPSAQIYCCTLITNASVNGSVARDDDGVYPTKNANGLYLEDINAKIRELAQGYGAHIIDLATCGIHWGNIANLTVDNVTHPNDAGHTLIAKKVISEILKNNY